MAFGGVTSGQDIASCNRRKEMSEFRTYWKKLKCPDCSGIFTAVLRNKRDEKAAKCGGWNHEIQGNICKRIGDRQILLDEKKLIYISKPTTFNSIGGER